MMMMIIDNDHCNIIIKWDEWGSDNNNDNNIDNDNDTFIINWVKEEDNDNGDR